MVCILVIDQLQFYNDDLNVSGASIRAINENTEASVFVSNEIGLELNDKKTIYGHALRPACSAKSQ
jgi:hypothetical protein